MRKNNLLLSFAVLVTAMMCALGAAAAEAYACYTSSNTTLTFYYDNYRSSRPGVTYDLNTGSNDPGWYTDGSYANVTKVVFNSSFASARPTTTNSWFYDMENLQSITGLSYLNTSEVTNMVWMFGNCTSLTSLDLSSFNTSKVTEMGAMFYSCSSLTTIDLSSFNTSKVTRMPTVFNGCTNLRTVYVGSGWSTAAVTSSANMFSDCTRLVGGQGTTYNSSNPRDKTYAHIDGGTSNPGYFTAEGDEPWTDPEAYVCYTPSNTTLTFYYDSQRSSRPGTTYDLNTCDNDPSWYTDGTKSNVTKVVFDPSFADARSTTTFSWFCEMGNLQSITGMSYLNTSEVSDMGFMFYLCDKLTSLDLSHFNTSQVTNMSAMFYYCSSLTSLDLSSFNTSKVTEMVYMFGDCSNLWTIFVGSGWNTATVTSSGDMFYNCTSLVGGKGTTWSSSNPTDKTYAHIDGGTSNPGYFTAEGEEPWTIVDEAYACYTPSNSTLTFYYDSQRSSRSGWTYDLNTGSDDPDWTFDGTNAIVTKVVFDPSFADAGPTTTKEWFYDMENLQSITGMEYLNTSEVTDMRFMFVNCRELTSLDLSHFNTSKVTDMNSMFCYCSSLTSLDLSSFNTSKVTNMHGLFCDCYYLRTIYAGNGWNTAAVTNSSDMFYGCSSLVGGRGTTWSSSNPTDKTYAHIDGGSSNPGYFTAEGDEPWEAYACYTSSNTTLTFYCDNQRSSRPGTTYDLNTGTDYPDWRTDGTNASVTKVVFDPSFAAARPTATYYWFYNMENLQSITGMSYLNTSETTNMAYIFCGCNQLTNIDVSHFNTSNVTLMKGMFYGCSSLTSLDLSGFNTSQVTNMSQLFYSCSSLTNLDLSSFNTSQVTSMDAMFNRCNNLRTVYVGNGWSTAAVTNSTSMFYGCTSLVGGQGTTYNSSNPTDKTYAHIDGSTSNPGYFTDKNVPVAYACYTPENTTLKFYYDKQRSSRPGTTYDLNTGSNDTGWETDGTNASVTKVVFDSSFAGARPTTTWSWFYDMRNLQSITGMSYLNTSEVTNMGWMFTYCTKLTSIDVSHFNTSQVTIMDGMFQQCSSLTNLDLSSFNTSQVTDMFAMFANSSNLRTVYVGNGWSTAAVTYSTSMFYGCTSLVGGQGTTYDSNHVNKTYAHIDGGPSNPGYFTEKGPEAYVCYTPSNTTLTFYYDNQRSSRTGTTYDLNTGFNRPGWDTDGTKSYVTKVVFDPSFADARPTSTYDWFFAMSDLESFTGMSYLNTSEVTNMNYMFCSSIKLTTLDLSSFNTAKVTNMRDMFQNCHSLISIDLSSFNTSQVIDMYYMFGGSNNLRTIYVGNGWSTAAVEYSNNMFYDCTSLVGGQGTTWNSSNPTDKTYAHIDGGPSNPGYFTAKNASQRGDINGDGLVNVADVTALIQIVLNSTPVDLSVADLSGDGQVNVADVTALIQIILNQ